MYRWWWTMIIHRRWCVDDEVWLCVDDDELWSCIDDDELWLCIDYDELHDHA